MLFCADQIAVSFAQHHPQTAKERQSGTGPRSVLQSRCREDGGRSHRQGTPQDRRILPHKFTLIQASSYVRNIEAAQSHAVVGSTVHSSLHPTSDPTLEMDCTVVIEAPTGSRRSVPVVRCITISTHLQFQACFSIRPQLLHMHCNTEQFLAALHCKHISS